MLPTSISLFHFIKIDFTKPTSLWFRKLVMTILFIFSNVLFSTAQVTLNADGPGDTYELINSKLAPSGNVVETPDQLTGHDVPGTHPQFGRHIAEVWDDDLGKYVFEFYTHLDTGSTGVLDNDVSTTSTDRQRVEIKTYSSSPDNLKGTVGETVTYKWRFKVPVGFKPTSNFSHLHQVKAVGGDDSNPLFSLTARAGSPNKLEVNFVASATSGTTKIANLNLSLFEGIWVEVTEIIKIGANGTYDILIKRVDNDVVIFSYNNNNILTIRPDNTFIRPKWGIYRSIVNKSIMRDEAMRFSDFSIAEGTLSTNEESLDAIVALYPNPVQDHFIISDDIRNKYSTFCVYDTHGKLILTQMINSSTVNVSLLSSGIYFVKFFALSTSSAPVKIIKS